MNNIRRDLATALKEVLPKAWEIHANGIVPDNPLKPVIIIKQSTITRTPQAPRLYRDITFTVSLVEPGLAPDKVEDALDVDVDILIDALEDINFPGLIWQEAQRVVFNNERFHGYDITATITTEKDTP